MFYDAMPPPLRALELAIMEFISIMKLSAYIAPPKNPLLQYSNTDFWIITESAKLIPRKHPPFWGVDIFLKVLSTILTCKEDDAVVIALSY